VGDLFSSPGKSASQAASAVSGVTQQDIQQVENYENTTEGQERAAIANLGPNPYLTAAGQMNPAAYQVNPANTASFGNQGPGTTSGQSTNLFSPQAPIGPGGGSAPPQTRTPQPVARVAPQGGIR
jgi:hypothetical protein